MNEMIQNNLTVTTMQVNVQFLQQLQPEWSRFVTIVKQQHKRDEVSYHKLFDILKQYQNEVNELRAERIARNANPLALVATAQADQDQYYQTSRSHKSHAPSSKPLIPSRSHTSTRHKGKEIAKPITPLSKTASEKDIDPKQAQRDKDMHKNLALIRKYFKKIYKPTNKNLRTSSNSKNKNVDTTPREFRHFAKECRKPKKVKDSAYHKEKMLLCKQVEQGVLLQAEQYDWLADTDEEVDKQELEAHYSYMAMVQEVPTADSGTDLEPVEQNDQNDVESDDEHVTLANLIANLKRDVDENKRIHKQLKKANTTLAQELKEYKTILAETNALAELQCMYLHKVKECDCLAQKLLKQTDSVSKKVHAELLQRFAKVEKHLIFLEIPLQKCKEQTMLVSKANVSEGLSKPITAQTLPQTARQAIVQLILFIVDSGCTNHMTSNLKALCNFVEKFLGTVRFGNDQFAPILGHGDFVQGNVTINRFYYVEGLNYNIFLVGQFCDADLKDEIPEVLKDFLTMIQRNPQAPVINVQTDRGT
nr:integrase, catalytic region, zinc finger, CCHC-type, peptidase aspartic, catalytic [Tanacetum cinerariifolium]